MPRRWQRKNKTSQRLREQLNREFTVLQDQCEHDQRFNDPASIGRVWKRCAQCGLVLGEYDRCPQRNPDGSQCLAGAVDGHETCYAHSEERKSRRTEVPPVWETYDQ